MFIIDCIINSFSVGLLTMIQYQLVFNLLLIVFMFTIFIVTIDLCLNISFQASDGSVLYLVLGRSP